MPGSPSVIPLLLFFVGLALCFWRIPQADRWHVILCMIAGVRWFTLPIFEPTMRRSGYPLVVTSFLIFGLSQRLRRRAD